jgi:hypothetical protein
MIKPFVISFFIIQLLISCSPKLNNCNAVVLKSARQIFSETVIDTAIFNGSSSEKNLLVNKEMAADIAEPILFSTYGRSQIVEQRPYRRCLIDNYWMITGTFQRKYSFGGTFLIILDARTSKVIKVTHGK